MKARVFLGILSLFLARMAVAQEVDYNGIHRLEIHGGRFSLTVRGEPGDRLSGLVQGDPRDNVKIQRTGSTLVITVDNQWNIFDLGPKTPGTMVLRVPFNCDLDLETASGDIRVEDLDQGGLVLKSSSGAVTLTDSGRGGRITTTSGDIRVRGAAGNLRLNSTSGSLRVMDALQGVRADTTSGSIEASNVAGVLDLVSVSGSLTLKNWTAPQDAKLKTVSGSIRATGLDSRQFSLRGSTVSGSARIWGSQLKGDFRTGNGPLSLEVSTVSGSISLE